MERKVEGTRLSFIRGDNPAPSPEERYGDRASSGGAVQGQGIGDKGSSGGAVDSSLRAESSGQMHQAASASYKVRLFK